MFLYVCVFQAKFYPPFKDHLKYYLLKGQNCSALRLTFFILLIVSVHLELFILINISIIIIDFWFRHNSNLPGYVDA